MDIIWNNLPTIIGLVLGIGVVWLRVQKLLVVAKETRELFAAAALALLTICEAVEDKNLTKEEIAAIKEKSSIVAKEAKDIIPALKDLLKK